MAALPAHIFQLNISPGGVPKLPTSSVLLTAEGLVGDWQRNRRYHGGPNRALCIYALEAILHLQAEGHPVFPGSMGENITLVGVDLTILHPGSILELGDEAVVQITSYTVPCRTIAGSFSDGKTGRISHTRAAGLSRLYARVQRGGMLRTAMPVRLLPESAGDEQIHGHSST